MYARLSRAYPRLTNAFTGATVTCTGDTAVQFGIEHADAWDGQRTGVCSCYSFLYAAPLAAWFGYMDRCFPLAQSSMSQFMSKIFVNQFVSSFFILTPGFVAWSCTIEEVVRGNGFFAGLQRTRKTFESDLLQLSARSFCIWLPVNAAIFRFASVHHRIFWISSVAVFWQGYTSWVAHGRIERAPQSDARD